MHRSIRVAGVALAAALAVGCVGEEGTPEERACAKVMAFGGGDDTGKTSEELQAEALKEWRSIWDVAKDAEDLGVRNRVQRILDAIARGGSVFKVQLDVSELLVECLDYRRSAT